MFWGFFWWHSMCVFFMCCCLMRSRFAAYFCVPCWTRAYLNANVVVLFFCHVNKYSKEGKDRVRAEEGALWPDYSCWQKTQENCQNPVEGLPEHTLPVPLWGNTQTCTHIKEMTSQLQGQAHTCCTAGVKHKWTNKQWLECSFYLCDMHNFSTLIVW